MYNDASGDLSTVSDGWYADVGFGGLTVGKQYKVCVDFDPSTPETNFEETGRSVVLTGVTGTLNGSLMANQSQVGILS